MSMAINSQDELYAMMMALTDLLRLVMMLILQLPNILHWQALMIIEV